MDEVETTAEELRELIRQGHSMIKDLNGTTKGLRQAKADLYDLIEQAKAAPKDEVEKAVREVTDQVVKQIAEETSTTANDCMAVVEKAIFDRFDILMNTILGIDDREGRLSIPDMLAARASGLVPKLDLEALKGVAKPIDRGRP